MHEASSVHAHRLISLVVSEVLDSDRPFDDAVPPLLPGVRRVWRAVRADQVLPAERTPRVLPGEQAGDEVVQRG